MNRREFRKSAASGVAVSQPARARTDITETRIGYQTNGGRVIAPQPADSV
jgi:hypothetical protein